MKNFLILVISACAMQAPALVIEADAPAKFMDGTAITPELSGFLRGTLYAKAPQSGAWKKIDTTPDSTFCWTVGDLVPGVWQFCVTAQFLDLTGTESLISDILLYEVTDPPDGSGNYDGDTDEDGMSDSSELIAGTLPENPASVLSLACAILPDGRRRLSWFGVKSRGYTLQYCDSMSGGWQSYPVEFSGADSAISFTDSDSAETRFYRLQVRITGK